MLNRLFFVLKINLFKNQSIIQIISILKIKILLMLYTHLIVSEKLFKKISTTNQAMAGVRYFIA